MARRKLTPERYFTECRLRHNSKYDYRDSVYKGSQRTITYVCPIHGERTQIANNHRSGSGCPDCGWERGAQKRSLGTHQIAVKIAKQEFNSLNQNFNNVRFHQSMRVGPDSYESCAQTGEIPGGNSEGEEYDIQHVQPYMSQSEYPSVSSFRSQRACKPKSELKIAEPSPSRKTFNFIMIKFHQREDVTRGENPFKGSPRVHKSEIHRTIKGHSYIDSCEYHRDKFANTFAKIRVSD